jgi:hypothetical protein
VIINLPEIFGKFFIVYLHKIKAAETINKKAFLEFKNDQRSSDIAFTWVFTYVLITASDYLSLIYEYKIIRCS